MKPQRDRRTATGPTMRVLEWFFAAAAVYVCSWVLWSEYCVSRPMTNGRLNGHARFMRAASPRLLGYINVHRRAPQGSADLAACLGQEQAKRFLRDSCRVSDLGVEAVVAGDTKSPVPVATSGTHYHYPRWYAGRQAVQLAIMPDGSVVHQTPAEAGQPGR